MIRYRLYTENKKNIDGITSKLFDGFTLLKGTGYWRGKREGCLIIEILADKETKNIEVLANTIKRVNKQESVYVTSEPVTAALI